MALTLTQEVLRGRALQLHLCVRFRKAATRRVARGHALPRRWLRRCVRRRHAVLLPVDDVRRLSRSWKLSKRRRRALGQQSRLLRLTSTPRIEDPLELVFEEQLRCGGNQVPSCSLPYGSWHGALVPLLQT